MDNQRLLQDKLEEMIRNMSLCIICGKESIIQVATSNNIPFYSCITEGCSREAQLLVDIGDGELVNYERVYDTLKETVKNGKSNKTDNNESES